MAFRTACSGIEIQNYTHVSDKVMPPTEHILLMSPGGTGETELVIKGVRAKSPQRAQDGNREWVTLIECVSATGNQLPAFYIYAGKAHYSGWHKEGNGIGPDTVLHIPTMAGRRISLVLNGFRTISENSLPPLHQDEPDSSFATTTGTHHTTHSSSMSTA